MESGITVATLFKQSRLLFITKLLLIDSLLFSTLTSSCSEVCQTHQVAHFLLHLRWHGRWQLLITCAVINIRGDRWADRTHHFGL